MRNYQYCDINEVSKQPSVIGGGIYMRFSYEKNLLAKTNAILLGNFNKVARWVEENCPTLNGEPRLNRNGRNATRNDNPNT